MTSHRDDAVPLAEDVLMASAALVLPVLVLLLALLTSELIRWILQLPSSLPASVTCLDRGWASASWVTNFKTNHPKWGLCHLLSILSIHFITFLSPSLSFWVPLPVSSVIGPSRPSHRAAGAHPLETPAKTLSKATDRDPNR